MTTMEKKKITNQKKKLYSKYSDQDISRIKKIAKQHERELLQLLGFNHISNKGVQQRCPIHGGDNRTAFSYDLNKHCWSCFSQHCERKYGNDIIGLIRGIKNIGFNDALSWLKEILIDNKNIDWRKIDEAISLENLQDIHKREYNKVIDESKLDALIKDYSSLKDRNFSLEVLEEFEGGVSKSGPEFHHRFMIPIRNDNHKIVGFTGRSIYNRCNICDSFHSENSGNCPNEADLYKYSKWRHYPTFFKKHIELYNINKAKDYIYNSNTAIIVEGPFDVWRLWEFGTKNVVATFGTSLSMEQCTILGKYGCINMILMFDSDRAGLKAIENTTKIVQKMFKVYAANLPKDVDPGSLGLEEHNRYVKPIIDTLMEIKNNDKKK